MKIKLLTIGHCCHDKTAEGGFAPGGTSLYASLAASALGADPSVISSMGEDFLFHDLFATNKIALINQMGSHTTIFENIYHQEGRTQYLLAKGDVIDEVFVKENSPEVDIVLLCPICDEVPFSLSALFPTQLVASTIQGWLREINTDGKVTPKVINWSLLVGIHIIILSKEDIATIPDSIEEIIKYVPIVVLTDGHRGATIYENGVLTNVPVFPVHERDATGAGDVFAVSFLLHYFETRDTYKSCIFAHAAASFIVEGNHIINLPSIEKINARILHFNV